MLTNNKTFNLELLQNAIPFGKVNYFDSVDSTNSWLLKHGHCGDICISEMQSAGRGRRGNEWISPNTGNIYFSLCWCFDGISKHWSLLGLVVGIAIAESLAEVGLNGHGVKWPNDIFWQQKKLGGILLETVDQSGKVIIGIGLNITMPAKLNKSINQKIVSLDEAMPKQQLSREKIVTSLTKKLHQHLAGFNTLNFDKFIELWKRWDILQDEIVNFTHQNQEIMGKVVEIDPHGRLGILMKKGEVAYFSSADIQLRKTTS